jgi:hypothetical protein
MPPVPPMLSAIGRPPPFGSTPMARPSANMGEAANAAAIVGQAVDLLEKALQGIPPQHPLHKTVLNCISRLSKDAPPASQSPGVGQNLLQQLAQEKMRASPTNPLLAALGGAGGGAGAGGPGAAAGGGPPGMPSVGMPPMPPPGGAAAGGPPPPG